jgi:hypothetical protein
VSNCPGEPLQDPCSLSYVIYSLTIRNGETYNMSAKIMISQTIVVTSGLLVPITELSLPIVV